MIGHIAYAVGSPCPTLVLERALLPAASDDLREALTAIRKWMISSGYGSVMKMALIGSSRHPLFDLDYEFVQALPGPGDAFDFRGSCGHSILSSIMVASRIGLLSRLAPADRVRVNVLNNGDNVVCEVDQADRTSLRCTVHFLLQPERRLGELLLTGTATTELRVHGTPVTVSLVSMGNPYVFVDAAEVGACSKEALFGDDPDLFDRLVAIRSAAAELLGWPVTGAFPKVAAVGVYEPAKLAVRAVTVPGWHPTLALTGVTCLGVATAIEDTIPYARAREAGCEPSAVTVDTPGGTVRVSVAASGTSLQDQLAWVSADRKSVRYLGSLPIEADLFRPHSEEISACLPLPT